MGGSSSKSLVYAEPVSQPKQGETAVYRCPGFTKDLARMPSNGVKTVQELFLRNFSNLPEKSYLGRRLPISYEEDSKTKKMTPKLEEKFTFLTFKEVEQKTAHLAAGIEALGLAPVKAQYKNYRIKFIGIHGKNTLEWVLTDITCAVYGLTSMPLYDTLGEEAVEHMLDETELETLFLTAEHIKKHVERIKGRKAANKPCFLKNLVILDQGALTDKDREVLKDINWFTFEQILEKGSQSPKPTPPQVSPNDIACFSYTSGTTGAPKGAMISHQNLISTVAGAEHRLKMVTSNDVYLSYLPLAHVFEKIVCTYVAYKGAQYAIFNGDVLKIKEDLAILKPTFFVSVPRLFNKFHDTIRGKTEELTGCKATIANKAFKSKLKNVEEGDYKHALYDRLVFNKMREVMGGRVNFMLSGSAPLSVPVKKFLKAAFCCPFIEGYGQTEGTGGQFCTDPEDPRLDTVGGPLPMNEFKLIDVPEMKYLSSDVDEKGQACPRGEIYVRGFNVIPGYYKNDEKNAETFDNEGWLRSGDIGCIIPGTNALKIIDRRKNIFKLSHGEYVAPDKLEQIYKTTPGVADIFVYGSSLKSSLVSIVNLDEATALKAAQAQGISASSIEELARNPAFIKYMIDSLRKTSDSNGLKGFERIAKVYIDPIPFGQRDLITTTFKLKRQDAKEVYKQHLEELYSGLD